MRFAWAPCRVGCPCCRSCPSDKSSSPDSHAFCIRDGTPQGRVTDQTARVQDSVGTTDVGGHATFPQDGASSPQASHADDTALADQLSTAAGALAGSVHSRELIAAPVTPVTPWTGAVAYADSVDLTFDGATLCIGVRAQKAFPLHTRGAATDESATWSLSFSPSRAHAPHPGNGDSRLCRTRDLWLANGSCRGAASPRA